MLLYPTGITSEVGLIYTGLQYMKVTDAYAVYLLSQLQLLYQKSVGMNQLGLKRKYATIWEHSNQKKLGFCRDLRNTA